VPIGHCTAAPARHRAWWCSLRRGDRMRGWWGVARALAIVLVVGLIGYTGYIGYEGSRRAVDRDGTSRDCRTPEVQFGWAYEAINYDVADDAELAVRNPDLADCG
jgi:hypothetical protein